MSNCSEKSQKPARFIYLSHSRSDETLCLYCDSSTAVVDWRVLSSKTIKRMPIKNTFICKNLKKNLEGICGSGRLHRRSEVWNRPQRHLGFRKKSTHVDKNIFLAAFHSSAQLCAKGCYKPLEPVDYSPFLRQSYILTLFY